MKTLYLDCFSGAAGNMLVGSLIDLGLKVSALEWEIAKLELPEAYHFHADRDQRQSVTGIHFGVHEGKTHQHDCGCGHDHPHEHAHAHDGQEHSHGQGDHDHSHSHEHTHDSGHTPAHEPPHDHGHSHEHHDGHGDHAHAHGRNFSQIRDLIEKSTLSATVKKRAVSVFHRVAVAEGKIHSLPPEQVAFHEVGALDSIIDIVGFCAGIEKLGIEKIRASRLVEGTGWVDCAHGRFPVPSTATLEILQGIPLTQVDEPHELLTPTGAALLAEFAESFGPMENLRAVKIGYGLGTRRLKSRPNVVRAVLCEEDPVAAGTDTVAVLETNLDDATGEVIGHAQELLFAAGALDVYYQPIQMKKNRPGVLLSVIVEESKAAALTDILLTQTTAFGIRQTIAQRTKLDREIKIVQTEFGPVEVKIGSRNGQVVQVAPEFESCRALAAKTGQPLVKIHEAARRAA